MNVGQGVWEHKEIAKGQEVRYPIVIEVEGGDITSEGPGDELKGPVARAVDRHLKEGMYALADPGGYWIAICETEPWERLVMEYWNGYGGYRTDVPMIFTLWLPRAYLKEVEG